MSAVARGGRRSRTLAPRGHGPIGAARAAPYDLGRSALQDGRSLLQVVAQWLQSAHPEGDDSEQLIELLAPFEMALTGYRETIDRLRQTNRLLGQTNADLALFTRAMAHDLRNPLATIAMWASLARARAERDTRGAADLLPILDQIEEVAGHAMTLVGDLLRYSELEKEAGPAEAVDLRATAQRVATALEAVIVDHGARLEVGELPVVQGRPRELEQLLQNLVENSIKYRTERPPLIRLEAVAGASEWTLLCRDNGRGVPAELRERAFEPFVRGDASLPGSGLGLAICRRIAERHGGSIRVAESGPRGTTIALTLPR
jgi:signal transduction histidine kinase